MGDDGSTWKQVEVLETVRAERKRGTGGEAKYTRRIEEEASFLC